MPPGSTILDAARKLGVDIPTLCFLEGQAPSTSCMVCVVKVKGRLVPSCATKAAEGMRVESETDGVRDARKAALELLLSDHLGDCVAPCQNVCPAHMNVPLMLRRIAAGEYRDALITVKERIALPAVLGRICPAPCEKGCRRGDADAPVSICLLKRFVADADLASESPYVPSKRPDTGKKVAIVGAGPTGLSAAYHLLREGHACTVFDDREKPGGMLRYGVPEDELPREVLDAEIGIIERMGAVLRPETRIGNDRPLADLQRDFDAVLVATGKLDESDAARLGLEGSARGVKTDRASRLTSLPGVFAGGGAVRPLRMAVRAVADGRAAAVSIGQYLAGARVAGPERAFSTRIGKLREGEIDVFMANASAAGRLAPADGFAPDGAREEARRCLHCDCRKPAACKLRRHAQTYGADPRRYARRGEKDGRMFERHSQHPDVVYEPGKCIDCGLCIKIAEAAREPLALTFIGRGFDVRVGVPFSGTIAEALSRAAAECVAACPTGALAFKRG